jgi:hypothetical protein
MPRPIPNYSKNFHSCKEKPGNQERLMERFVTGSEVLTAEYKPGSLRTSATNWPIVPAMVDCVDGEFGGMKIGRGNRSTRRKPASVPL